MEVKKDCGSKHDNKENIPPSFMSKKPGLNDEKGKCALVKVNGRRRPLRDITNFYRAVEKSELKLPSSDFSSSRKRKVADDGAEQRPCSKILRRDYR